MEAIMNIGCPPSIERAMLDSGATVPPVPLEFVDKYKLTLRPHTDGRRIGTADNEGSIEILGWIDLAGYVGLCAVCSQITFIIISTGQIQRRGLGSNFLADQPNCQLYTNQGVLATVDQCTSSLFTKLC